MIWLGCLSGYKTLSVLSLKEGKPGILCIPGVCPSALDRAELPRPTEL